MGPLQSLSILFFMLFVGSSIVSKKIVRLAWTTLYIWGYLSGNFARFVTLQTAERTTRSKVNRIIEFFGRDLKNWNWLSRDIAVLVGPRPYAPLMAFATCYIGTVYTQRLEWKSASMPFMIIKY